MNRFESYACIGKDLDIVFDELALGNFGDYLLGARLFIDAQKIPSF